MTSNASARVASEPRRRALPASRWGRWGVPVAVYGLLALLAVLAGYWLMYSQFAVYDDEGFFDYSLKLFVDGHAMYNQVFSDYGPFYYLVFGGLFSVLGHSPTTDAGRLIQLTLWVVTSLGVGAITHRLTGRLSLGAASMATVFLLLTGATSEPMHASMLNDFVEMLIVLVLAFGLRRWSAVSLGIAGALVGALILTKINVGAYAFVAVGFAAVMSIEGLRRHRSLRLLASLALVLVGPVVMLHTFNSGWTQSYALLAGVSALAIVFAVGLTPDPLEPVQTERWGWYLAGGFVAALVVILALIFAYGTTPGKLITDIITVPSHQNNVLVVPITLGSNAIWWTLAFAGLAWAYRAAGGSRATWVSHPTWWTGALRGVAGITILLSLVSQSIFNVSPNAAFSLALPLAWVAAIPSGRDEGQTSRQLLRIVVPTMALAGALLAYPVAGTQIGYGSIMLVPCGAICVADAWSDLAVWERVRRPGGPFAASAIVSALCVALAVGAAYNDVLQPMEANHGSYGSNVALDVPGATRLHLPAATTTAIEQTIAALRSNGCQTLVSYPGMYSFDLWSGLPYVTTQTGEQPYWSLLSQAQQSQVYRTARRTPHLCVVRNDSLAASYGGHPQRSPIANYIADAFKPVATAAPYEVEVRKAGAKTP